MAPLAVGSTPNSKNSSWLLRLFGHFHAQAAQAVSANGAPLHFESIDMSARHGKAQTYSVLAHAALLAALLFVLASPATHHPFQESVLLGPGHDPLSYIPPASLNSVSLQPSFGRNGGGGENDPRPTRFGNLAPNSSMPTVPPRLTQDENQSLPAPPAVFDPNAPASVATVTHLGLPWMNGDTDSAGPGKHHGFGTGDAGTMGDGSGSGAGAGDSDAAYANVVSQVTCLYCPDPAYTEEARKAKLEGKILFRVLVGPDGKAQQIQVLHGLGMGLDECAEEAIRGWHFSPARDGAKRAVASWVTIETRFQLF